MSAGEPTKKQLSEGQRWIREPIYWARKFAGKDFDPWSGQEQLWQEYGKLLNAKINRYKGFPLTPEQQRYANKIGISIMAGQGLGKGANVSLIALHYLFALQAVRPKVVCTAPVGPLLKSSLWPEFGAWLKRSELLDQIFEKNADRIFLKEDASRGGASFIEPRTVQKNAQPDEQKIILAGIHATGVLYVCDEAAGIPDPVFEPIEGGLTDPLSLVIAIWNPVRRTGFAMETHRKHRELWIPLHWSGEELRKEKMANPRRFLWFNEDIQLQLKAKYGEDSDFYRVRVKGLPPNQSGDTLIPFDAVMDAKDRVIEVLPSDPLVIPVDVGGPNQDGDPSIMMPMRGPKVLTIYEYQQKDTTQLSELVMGHLKVELAQLPIGVQHAVGVDIIGIGRGVRDQLVNIHKLTNVYGIDVSEKSIEERRFHRLRDQIFWELREAFVAGEPVIPDNDELIGELTSIRWGEVDGKIKIQGKGGSSGIPGVPPLAKSPNRADTLAMGNYLRKHCVSQVPIAFRRQRRQFQRQRRDGARLGFRSIESR